MLTWTALAVHLSGREKDQVLCTQLVLVPPADNKNPGALLVAQWLRICLPMQGHVFDPWPAKIPHVAEQLNPCAATTESML